jgi:amino acid adenylation domain-containing protein
VKLAAGRGAYREDVETGEGAVMSTGSVPAETVADRAFWGTVLGTGGCTAIPRWTLQPTPGIAEHEAPIPTRDVAALRRVLGGSKLPLRSLLLAAHAAVLAALAGEREVVAGYLAGPRRAPLPCRLTTEPTSWRELVRTTHRAESQLLSHADFPVDDLRRELGIPGPSFDTVFDPTGESGDLGDRTALEVGVRERDGRCALRLRYRTAVLDAAAAARIAGYHLAALALIAADPDAEHRRQSLLSPEELRFQLDGVAGPVRELPDRRVHELFEQRMAAHPDAVAAEHRGRTWTYRELNARANRLGRALLARGLPRESVVAVVTERNLDWMAAVLAIWKAGFAYLPLEPHFPAARIAAALSRAECRLVLTEPGSTTTLDRALDSLPGVERLLVDAAYGEGHPDANLAVAVAPEQLAYVLFTSGSTGEPKGVMCEHAGMLNHIYAKLDDLAVAEGEVIPQTGPQCFDISVWQLVGALLVGGRTLLVEHEAILDVERFIDTIVAGRAAVLQVVPSYLDVLLTYLEQHPRELPDLHTVCPTGDLLKKELVQRWFAAQPGIPMVNTYGLTETSDDAVHAVMRRVPDRERIPLGCPIINTHVDVVDENHMPVPLGAPGLIVFSGVCVGRGYINDPERTARIFGPDPHRPGQRICRTGDHGRRQPDGTLDFLGRRDNQVKIRGFRIEIGETENALLRVPGVRDGAAVISEGPDGTKRLVGFYCGPRPLDDADVRGRLAETVPEYMVPSILRWRDTLPLTANGKIDRTTLTTLADELDVLDDDADDREPPSTPTELRIAAAWATVLGVPSDRIGRQDHLFDSGGTSLSAVKLAVALNRVVSLQDITRFPVLADLAKLIDSRTSS